MISNLSEKITENSNKKNWCEIVNKIMIDWIDDNEQSVDKMMMQRLHKDKGVIRLLGVAGQH
jgi:hypothetical protein